MVCKMQQDINDIFIQSLYFDDHILLKTIVEGMKYTRTNNLKALMKRKDEFGGISPFVFVCLQGHSNLVRMFLDTGVVDINQSEQYKWTALHAAAYSGDMKTVQVLINSCADCFAKDENNNLPIDLTNDDSIKSLLTETMRQKNLQKFNELVTEVNSEALPKKERHQRSKSCFANVSLLKLNELKTKLTDRKLSNTIANELSSDFSQSLRKWNTYSDLSLESILDLTC